MNDNDTNNVNQLAAEYVLGTLDLSERQAVKERRLTNAQLNQSIIDWEYKLEPLNEHTPLAEPRKDLFEDILTKLDAQSDKHKSSRITDINTVKEQLNRWRIAAMSASALAASLAVFIVTNTPTNTLQNNAYVAVFQENDKQPSFIMSLNIDTQQLTIRPITAEGLSGKTYQLWIKADEIGPEPRSLGLLTSIASPTQKQISYDPAILRNATFGISVEPEGGSPTGVPTGPAIHGKLYPNSI